MCQHAFMCPAVLADRTVTAFDQDFGARYQYGKIGDGFSFGDIWFADKAASIQKTIRNDSDKMNFCK